MVVHQRSALRHESVLTVPKEPPKKFEDLLTAFPYGMNSGVAPLLLPKQQAAFALNTTFRGGYATDRAARTKLLLDFGGDTALETAVRKGFFQGGGVYRPDFGSSQAIAQIGGRLFTFTENGSSWTVAEITIAGDPNDATTSQVWMWQSEKWMIISDGSAKLPIFYDGVSCRRSLGSSHTLVVASSSNPVGPPAIGSTIVLTIPTAYTGPLNIVVTFNGAHYEIIAAITTDVPPTPGTTIYNVGLTPVSSCCQGNTIVSGSNLVQMPSRIGLVTSQAQATTDSHGLDITIVIGSTAGLVAGGVVSVNAQVMRQGVPQIIQNAQISGTITTVVNSTDLLCHFPTATIPDIMGTEGLIIDIFACQIVSNNSPLPNVVVGQTSAAYVIPAFGVQTAVSTTAPYTGNSGDLVWIGDCVFSIVPGSAIPVPPIINPPLNYLTLLNIDDIAGAITSLAVMSISEIPGCRMGAYGLGQNWFSSVDGLSFGPSDLVGSSSGSPAYNFRDAVLKTTDLDVMGMFKIPVAGETITAMIFVATLDQALGQGPLQIGVPSGMFSCKAPFTLQDFQGITNAVTGDLVTAPILDPILTKSLVGFGPVAQNSTVLANSDTVFRSFEGVSSLILARRNFSDIGGNTPISREMTRTIEQDRKDLLSYSSAIVFDNRLRMTTSPNVSSQGVFHMGELVLNYDLISSLRGKASPVWDGLWTGNNILQFIQGLFGPESRAFAFTFNITDSQIELYELLPTGDVHFDNGTERIKWVIETPVIFNSDIKTLTDVVRLIDGEMYLSDINGQVDVVVLYRPLFYPCWRPWHSYKICSDMSATNAKQQVRYYLGLGEPDPKDCDSINDQPFRESPGFQLRIELTGHCKIWGIRTQSEFVPSPAFNKPAGTCDDSTPVCLALNCDVPNDLEVYSLDGLPPVPPPPTPPLEPNDFVFHAVTNPCGTGTTVTIVGTPLPFWISFDAVNCVFRGNFGTYHATTKAEANALAQSALDAFVATVIANGSIQCSADLDVLFYDDFESYANGVAVNGLGEGQWTNLPSPYVDK